MFTINDIFDKYRSISIERVNDFLTRKSIEHKCTELRKIEFRLEDWSWDLYIDDNYFKIDLVFPISQGADVDKRINSYVAEKACLEVTKLIKVMKAHYSSHEYVDEDNGNKLVKYNILLFNFESYCYNMYDDIMSTINFMMKLNQNCQGHQSDLGALTMMKSNRKLNLLIDTALVLFNLK